MWSKGGFFVSNPTVAETGRHNFWERGQSYLIILAMSVSGLLCFTMPVMFLGAILSAADLFLIGYGLFHFIRFFTSGKTRRSDLVLGLLVFAFGCLLSFNALLPEWMIRVCFGLYCLGVSVCIAIQQALHASDGVRVSISSLLFVAGYGILSYVLLFTPIVTTQLLIRLFGIYFLLLAGRMFIDLFDLHSASYHWKRGIHVSLPVLLATILPDVALRSVNAKVREGQHHGFGSVKKEGNPRLRAMVHIGPEGFQKVGHFTFCWDGTVFSYGNYDTTSGRFFGLIGDGVYFTVPKRLYIPNIVKYEQNTIFEYGIMTTSEQDKKIEELIENLRSRSYRWFSLLEKQGMARGIEPFESDYPSRLHYRTGAKFYKFRRGLFKTYWVAGDNCVLFADQILGTIGADVLSLKRIVTPGAYFDYLENEYVKENSPIVERRVYSWSAEHGGI